MIFKKVEKYTCVNENDKGYLEELKEYVSKSSFLPRYHIYPKCGLMNDPNGLAYFNGEYHFFYQWFPFEPSHGMKHWGHCKSKDLLVWEDQGIALTPDREYEKNGCYSGNAIEKDGLLYLFYTANYKLETGKIPKQALAIMDRDGQIKKYEQNPVIDGAPDNMSGEIRDPFVFRKDGMYYMLLGAKSLQETGALLLYASEDLVHWNYQGEIDLPVDTGYMIECPGYIQVDGKDILIFSPMGLKKEPLKYQNQFATVYLVGTLDMKNRKFNLEYTDEVDCGYDFYAPQPFYGKEHRPMLLAWFGCGEQTLPSDSEMWKHGLTMPRVLSLSGNRLTSFPAAELEELFSDQQTFEAQSIAAKMNTYHIQFTMSKERGDSWVRFGRENDYWELSFDFEQDMIKVDRSRLKAAVDPDNGVCRCSRGLCTELYQVDIYVDNSFAEIFINKGMKSFSIRCFNLAETHFIQFNRSNHGRIDYGSRK